ncbi:LCP family protein [Xiamenia xianingshaonis]|uniref:LCP family protein n=1 Tax=Xiamenia xianingshaonis TaxID=2682776 RepID=A0A9E6MQV1_9ACTN|nr:LCP family protein [Xiamenia xianingshaonis]NHM13443.1 LytR family transcriptional regulator [Xiamenia xianingshaonis]QTU84480.1 LCP family protein [Xiamenia xianingshaonis]
MTPKNSRSGRVARSSHQSQSARASRVAQAAQAVDNGFEQEAHHARQAAASANSEKAPVGAYTPVYQPGTQKSAAANKAFERQSAVSQYSRSNPAYSHRKTSKGRKVLIGLLIAIVVLGVGATAAFALTNAYLNSINDKLNTGTKSADEVQKIIDTLKPAPSGFDEPFYMILIGSDEREEDASMGQRSDTNIVVRVDAPNSQLTLVSIPRDTKIEIDGYGTNKFNAAYSYDGTAGVIREASQLLGVDISHYAEVDFSQLVDLVDAVGGVDVYVEERIDDPDADGTSANPDWDRIILEVGEHHLNGDQALCFARSRAFVDGDFTRTNNQRQLIEAIVEKVLAMPVTELPGVIDKAAACVSTDLTVQDIITLAQYFSEGDLTMYSAMVPSYTQMIGDVSYVINDEEKTKEMMEVVDAGGDPSEIVSTKTADDAEEEIDPQAFEEYDETAYSETYDTSSYATDGGYTEPYVDPYAGGGYDTGYVEPAYVPEEPAPYADGGTGGADGGYVDAGAGADAGAAAPASDTGAGTDTGATGATGEALPEAA